MSATAPPRTRRIGLQAIGLVDGTALAVDPDGRLLAVTMRGPQSRPLPVVLARRLRRQHDGSTSFEVRCPACRRSHHHGDEGQPLGWRQADCPGGPAYFVVTHALFHPTSEES